MDLSSSDKVRQLYEDSAAWYEQTMDKEIQLPVYDEVLADLATRLVDVDGAILDSSCGTGHMLELIRDRYLPERRLLGIDLSPKMVALARNRLGDSAAIFEDDMASCPAIERNSCAAVISFYAIHHVGSTGLEQCLAEWKRVLVLGGQLVLAAWEGKGNVEYGDQSDVVARRYTCSEIEAAAINAGFQILRCTVKPTDDFDMDTVHLVATCDAAV